MPEIKQIDPCAVASVACGVMLCEQGFGAVHEAVEWLLGHPIWTHEFVHPAMQAAMVAAVKDQYPDLAFDKPDDWRAAVAAIRTKYGDTIPVRKGVATRTDDPISTLNTVMAARP